MGRQRKEAVTGLNKLEKGSEVDLQCAQPVVTSPPSPSEVFCPLSLSKASHGLAVPIWRENGGGLYGEDRNAVVWLGRISVSRTCLVFCGGREGSE